MASLEHIQLSNFIKAVHQDLREKSQALGTEKAWINHCKNEENLKNYAKAMRELATNYWEENYKLDNNLSRIVWTCVTCKNYFQNDIHKYREKEKEIAGKINCTSSLSETSLSSIKRLKLLDVGSCYNPFKECKEFDVTAVDIAPAIPDVLKCDFLNIKIDKSFITNNNQLLQLPKNYFDIVVFSLLLEYLPSPKQRLICCEKAYEVIHTEGLLIIITPDSNHVGANAKYIKSWRFVLAQIGFSRIKYEKLPHIHCMAFRKSFSKEIPKRWTELHRKEQVYSEIYIPQDFKVRPELATLEINDKEHHVDENFMEFMKELPEL